MWLENQVKKTWGKVSVSEKAALFSCFIVGMLAHMYIWTNTIPNFDGLSRMYEEQQMTLVGRWFLHYTAKMHDYTQMPMMIGVFAMLCLAISSSVIVRVFDIKNTCLAGIWGGMTAVFPTIAYINTYTFTALEYCFAIMLSVISVYLVRKKRIVDWVTGCILVALTMGVYQAFVCVAITMSVLLVFKDMLTPQKEFGKSVKDGFVYMAYIGTGAGIYYIVLQIFLKIKDLKIITYLGMDQVADGYPFDMLKDILVNTYKQVFAFFGVAKIDNSFANKGLVFGHFCILVFLLALLGRYAYKCCKKNNILGLIGGLILLFILPIAMNFVQIMSPYSVPTAIMKFAYIFFYFLPILLLDMLWTGDNKDKENCEKKYVLGGIEIALTICLLCTSFYFWKYDNVLYTMLNQTHRTTLSFVTNVVGRVESCEGYQYGMPVVVVGGFPSDRYFSEVESYMNVQQNGALSSSVMPLNKHIYYYMQDWLNIPIQEPTEDVFLWITDMQEFKEMPLYPNDGSVKIIEGCVVVKMQTTYTPKALYEIEYEKRR